MQSFNERTKEQFKLNSKIIVSCQTFVKSNLSNSREVLFLGINGTNLVQIFDSITCVQQTGFD